MEVVADNQVAQLLNDTLSVDVNAVRSATDALDRLSLLPHFPFSLLSVAAGGENQGQRIAAATYLKNFMRRNVESEAATSNISKEFKDELMRALLQVEPAILKVLLEAFRVILVAEFVKQNSWPELVIELRAAIQNSNLINHGANCGWNTVNALTILHAVIRPFQYFLNPKVAKEPVPAQLELISQEILVPVLAVFGQFVEKVLAADGRTELEMEKILLIVCKCIYFSVRSHMPPALAPQLPSFCHNLIAILGSLKFDYGHTPKDGYVLRLKTAKRSLLIFCALVTRHRKYSDKLMPDIVNCVLRIVKCSTNISKLDFLQERIISLAFDVISHILETGPGWRLVSPHFLFLLDTAIFPALVLNEKFCWGCNFPNIGIVKQDVSEWEEDADEYIRKNLPSELEEISGWREDLFTARKSAINLLGVISMSKGPPVGTSSNSSSASSKRKKSERSKRNSLRSSMGELLVLPFLSKFPIPCDANAFDSRILKDYFGVLMAYGGLQDFLREQKPEFTTNLVRCRVLPLYTVSACPPYLVASANWVLGELVSCLPEDMSGEVYTSLLKALAMPDMQDISCYPVRASAAGAILGLLDNDYLPPEWYPLLQVLVGRIGSEDEENSILFQLLSSVVGAANENVADHIPYIVSSLVSTISKCIHPSLEPWPQVVERGFAALALVAQSWENLMPEEAEQNDSSEKWTSGQATIAKALSVLLQQAWLTPAHPLEGQVSSAGAPPSCIDDASTLLRSIMLSVSGSNIIVELKLSELLLVWADLIADWHAWEETEDLSIFDCIEEVVSLHSKYGLKNFIVRRMPSPPAPPVPQQSIIEGIGAFLSEAILQYPSATWRACACVHTLLHVPNYTETEGVKQSLAIAFSRAAFSHFRRIQRKPCSLWKPLVLAIASCYLCYPDIVEGILKKDEDGGCTIWGSALAYICSSSFEPRLSLESEIKLVVLTLANVVERMLELGNTGGSLLGDCYASLIEVSVRLKELQEETENDEEDAEEAEDEDDDESIDDNEDSEDDEHEETEEQFLERYAKAALEFESDSLVEEGDVGDQEREIELGPLEEIDPLKVLAVLLQRYHNVLIQGQALPSQLISKFSNAFPQYALFFQ